MKIKTVIGFALLAALLIFVAVISAKIACLKCQAEVSRLSGETAVYKGQSEKYAEALKQIKQTAAAAGMVEEAQ